MIKWLNYLIQLVKEKAWFVPIVKVRFGRKKQVNDTEWSDIKYFKPEEFDSPDLKGSGINMNYDFMIALDKLRIAVGRPFYITSGYRTLSHNSSLLEQGYQAVNDSAHIKGLACDIACTDNDMRYKILFNALNCGFKRIGIASSFIHVDIDNDKAQEVVWVYK